MKGFSQKEESTVGVKATFHTGAILPHRPLVNEVIEGHTQAYEISFYKSTTGKKEWQQLYNYPKMGVSALAVNLGNERELGMGYGIFPYIEIPLNKRKLNLRIKIGYGLGYIEKPFNRETNYKNITIGSHYNAIIYVNMGWAIKLSNAFSTSAGVSLIHFSNGSYSRPNLGLNNFSLNTGLAYNFGEKKKHIVNDITERPHKWTKKVMFGVGVKEILLVDGPKYFVSSYSFNLIKTRAQKSSFGFGADVFYNTSLSNLIAEDKSSTPSDLDDFRVGLVGIYSFDFGRVSFLIEMGGYVFSKYKGNGDIYNRFVTRFNVTDKVFINLSMKTHFAVADFIEYGVGYNF
ncbi:MAG: acyloxyacyl hydrolase [Flavobacteriales bacterium]|nr:acyloxyacyl hydrolase [Flavobacteriales bacterium]